MMRNLIRVRMCLLNTLIHEVHRSKERFDLLSDPEPSPRWSPRLRWLIIVGASVAIWVAIFAVLF